MRACTQSRIPACGCDSTHVFAVSVFRPIGVSGSVHVCMHMLVVFVEDSSASVTSSLKDARLAGPQSSLSLSLSGVAEWSWLSAQSNLSFSLLHNLNSYRCRSKEDAPSWFSVLNLFTFIKFSIEFVFYTLLICNLMVIFFFCQAEDNSCTNVEEKGTDVLIDSVPDEHNEASDQASETDR